MSLLSVSLFGAGFLTAWYWQRRLSRHAFDEVVARLTLKHEQDFAELINRFNHEGPIPHNASAVGLIALILSAQSRATSTLKERLKAKDWNTQTVITELEEITENELLLLHKKLSDFLESRRDILRDYNENQGIK